MSKGSRSRPLSVARDEYINNWDKIFNKKKSSDYQDILTTEECVEAALDKMVQINQELGLYDEDK
jgi:hypothetical protein